MKQINTLIENMKLWLGLISVERNAIVQTKAPISPEGALGVEIVYQSPI